MVPTMKLTSPAFSQNQQIDSKYTCDGENVSPPLAIADVPSGAQSLALIVEDPDSPGGTFTHWLIWDIEPAITQIDEGMVTEEAAEGINDFGNTGYGGPCPSSGTHRYIFKLYALDSKLNLPAQTSKEDLMVALEGHILAQTELTGLYNR